MFDFYKTMYQLGYLPKSAVYDAAHWGVISLADYELVTGEEYVAT